MRIGALDAENGHGPLVEKKSLKKCLTRFFRNGIGLKNFNGIVFFVHKSTGKEVKVSGGVVVVNFVSLSRYRQHDSPITKFKEIKEEEER
jgi:hypothetical protein